MSVLHHSLVAVSYTLVAAAVAVGLPYLLPAVGADAGAVIGGVILVGSALLHEVFARQEGEARITDEVEALKRDHVEMRTLLVEGRRDSAALRETLRTAEDGWRDRSEGGHSVDSVVAEVKVLQGLIEQLWAARTGTRIAAPAEAGFAAKAATTVAAKPLAGAGGATMPAAGPGLALVARDGKPVAPASPPDAMPPVARGLDDAAILNIVREGLETNRVDLVLQPIVNLPQRKRCYYEAYTRIRDSEGRMLVPEQYIAIAEREGLIAAIDNMMLFRCVQLVRRSQNRNSNLGFFCNISAHSLTDRHFFSNFVEFMADNATLAPNLIFEFPYATIANRDLDIERHLRQLASFGFRFSVDQVSGLNLDYADLMRHRFKFVKLDAAILIGEIRRPTAGVAPDSLKRLVDRHGIDLIVEKIESEPMLLELLDLRIDYGQGYLFGEPRLAKVD